MDRKFFDDWIRELAYTELGSSGIRAMGQATLYKVLEIKLSQAEVVTKGVALLDFLLFIATTLFDDKGKLSIGIFKMPAIYRAVKKFINALLPAKQ